MPPLFPEMVQQGRATPLLPGQSPRAGLRGKEEDAGVGGGGGVEDGGGREAVVVPVQPRPGHKAGRLRIPQDLQGFTSGCLPLSGWGLGQLHPNRVHELGQIQALVVQNDDLRPGAGEGGPEVQLHKVSLRRRVQGSSTGHLQEDSDRKVKAKPMAWNP